MIGPGKWLCGCTPAEKAHYLSDRLAHYPSDRRDSRGLLCPEHGEPMYGYLSPTTFTASGRDATDWGKMGTGSTVRINDSEIVDRRDNRPPIQAYMDRQKEKAMMANGHVNE